MYKTNFKKWVGLFILVITLFLGFNITNVNAKISEECAGGSATYNIKVKNKLTSDKGITITASNAKFNIKLTDEATFNNLGMSERDFAKEYVRNFKALWAMGINPYEAYGNLFMDYQIDARSGTGSITIDNNELRNKGIPIDDAEGEFYILIYPVYEGDDAGKDLCKDYFYNFRKVSFTNEILTNGLKESAYKGSIEARSGNAEKDWKDKNYCGWANDVYQTSDATFKSILNKTMPSCFPDASGNVRYNFSTSRLAKIASSIKKLYESYQSYLKTTAARDSLPELDRTKPWVEIKDPSKLKTDFATYKNALGSDSSTMLTCDAKDEETYKYLYYIDKHDENVTFSAGVQKGETKRVCTIECREDLIVKFGPPKAIIAGQCFTYEVEIKSVVNCISKLDLNGIPDVNIYIPNFIQAHCNDIEGYEDQAGPNEDFDACVNKCDGGEYSQSCIDKCYSEVYEKKDTKTTTTKGTKETFEAYKEDTITLASKMAATKNNNTSGCVEGTVVSVSYSGGVPSSADIQKVNNSVPFVYVSMWSKITGKYKPTSGNGTLSYTPAYLTGGRSSCKWYDYSYSYFDNLAMAYKTVCNDYGYNWSTSNPYTCLPANYNKATCSAKWGCYRGSISGHRYTGVNGFKRNTGCTEQCKWTRVGNNYYNDRKAAEEDYIVNLKAYVDKAIGCLDNSAAACKSSTANYKMTVNYDQDENSQVCTMGENSTNCKTWTASGNKTGISKESKSSILISNGGSCMGRNDNFMYHDILTFPGAWINNKNGKVTYDTPDHPDWYTYQEGNYCSPLNAKNVNAPYWRWYQNKKAGATTAEYKNWISTGSTDAKTIKYNITSAIENFGHYNWNFDVACFYAIAKDQPCSGTNCDKTPCSGSVCSDCTNKNCPQPKGDGVTPGYDNFASRSYTSSTIFPNGQSKTSDTNLSAKKLSYAEKMADSDYASRATGFNWTVDATNLAIAGYPVTPSALVKKIEATNAYTDSELDYDFVISTTNIRNIKNAAKKKADSNNNYYTSYSDGTYTTVCDSTTTLCKNNVVEDGSNSITFYKSDLIHSTGRGYVSNIKTVPGGSGLRCNNIKGSNSCDVTLSGYVSQDAELASWLAR